jgi:hypothetical protein
MDSSAVVIGAMLVAPLLGPVLGLALALAVGDGRLSVQTSAIVLYGSTAGNGDRPAHVPPGELHISLYQVAGGAPSEQTVFLAAGEEREIVFSREQ